MKALTINLKLIILVVFSLVILSGTILTVSVIKSSEYAKNDKLAQLNSITASKKQHIYSYFHDLEGLLISVANTSSTVDAMNYLSRFFYEMESELSFEDLNINDIKKEISSHYQNEYVNNINFNLSNIPSKKSLDSYLPQTNNGLLAQYIYIIKNDSAIGEKNGMLESTSYENLYTLNHSKYHDTFNTILKSYNLYDVFLVDNQGSVVYSTFKEKDFATNLKNGPYSNSGLAKVHEKALKLNKGEVAFADFKPYEPSYNTPASFMATPVINKKGKRYGNLIFQFPVSEIDGIMNFNGKFEKAGLGKTGNSYLVAQDYTMRNNYRFLESVKDEDVLSSKSTISLFEIRTDSTEKALSKQSGSQEIVNFAGENVLSSYDYFDVFGTTWAIVSEIDTKEAMEKNIDLNYMLGAISLGVLIIISIFSIFLLRSSIGRPLKEFEEGLLNFFKYLNNEIKDVKSLNDSKGDEIGKMSHVINVNIDKIKDSLEKDRVLINETVDVLSNFEKGDLSQRITKETTNPSLNELKNVLNKMADNLESNIHNILNVLEKYTTYNYLDNVDTKDLKEHILKLANGVNSLGDSITQMLIDNKTNGLNLDRNSDVLLRSVNTLSNNSNEAAVSIEETSAALEEINSNVQANNQNVQKMTQHAKEVTDSVKQGEELASKTSLSMDEINEQVNSINDAITVIDKIAFQTNILSLNAAVEAATAGEAGQGFAVVAQEVRNLASRSAEAAKEIKTLVENANVKANEGKEIADVMKNGYSSLSSNINNTIELIEAVSISSREQETGISQVNDAVASLDKQTQENAAIAQSTNKVALDTDTISKRIVSNADEKEFKGKDNIRI